MQFRVAALNLSPDSVLVQDKTLPTAELDGRTVVMSLSAGAYFDFNRVGTEIWRMLAEPCPVGRILDSLSQTCSTFGPHFAHPWERTETVARR